MKIEHRIQEIMVERAAAEREEDSEKVNSLALEQVDLELARRREELMPRLEAMQTSN
jgi:hypothetical protein